jgi:hypothetical protein
MSMRWILVPISVSAFCLSACGGEVRDKSISTVDFTDTRAIQAIEQRLDPPERALFDDYAFFRVQMPGREIVRPDGSAPQTVREAIQLARLRRRLDDERDVAVSRANSLLVNGTTTDPVEHARLEKVIAEKDAALLNTMPKR